MAPSQQISPQNSRHTFPINNTADNNGNILGGNMHGNMHRASTTRESDKPRLI